MDNRIDKRCMVEIRSTIVSSAGDRDEMVLSTQAQYQVKDGKGYLRYEESEISGMEGSKTLLKHDGDTVHIRRYGTVNSLFVIAENKPYETLYRTQYGEFLMQVVGRRVMWSDTDTLQIAIAYTLHMEGNEETSDITIEIRELK
ncbi:MAG: hypothetical protein PWP51_1769 [Clostridiales bacterium]|nr:hypothetical protein [Clostridiales bacterium]MDN5299216.1 hypothetical protein [Clostridiales bacterium]